MYTTLMQIFIFGDSITSGMWDTQGGWADQIKQRVTTQCINSHFEIDIEVYNLGISGNTSRDLLYRFELEIRQNRLLLLLLALMTVNIIHKKREMRHLFLILRII